MFSLGFKEALNVIFSANSTKIRCFSLSCAKRTWFRSRSKAIFSKSENDVISTDSVKKLVSDWLIALSRYWPSFWSIGNASDFPRSFSNDSSACSVLLWRFKMAQIWNRPTPSFLDTCTGRPRTHRTLNHSTTQLESVRLLRRGSREF